MVELADTWDLGSYAVRREGSSPSGSTITFLLCPDGGIGRRGGFKIRFRKEYEFKSHSGHHALLAQRIEQLPSKQLVAGSIPAQGTMSGWRNRQTQQT